MLEFISLKFTELPEPLVIPAQGVTIFVGPNNSGKSLVLRELELATSSSGKVHTKLLHDFEIVWLSEEELDADIDRVAIKPSPVTIPVDYIYVGRFSSNNTLEGVPVAVNNLRNFMKSRQEKLWITYMFLQHFLIRLDGRTRFELTNDRPTVICSVPRRTC